MMMIMITVMMIMIMMAGVPRLHPLHLPVQHEAQVQDPGRGLLPHQVLCQAPAHLLVPSHHVHLLSRFNIYALHQRSGLSRSSKSKSSYLVTSPGPAGGRECVYR